MHNYLGVRLDYGTKGKVRLTMHEHIEGILEAAAEDMDSVSDTPASNHMFQVQEYGGTLSPVQSNLFQNCLENILFVSCRSRSDLKTVPSFLTTRVLNTDEDNYKKLSCTILYIRGTQGMELTLEAESMDAI